MKEKYIRNLKLYWRWKDENYSIRGLSKMYKISHVRVWQIVKKINKEYEEYEKGREKQNIKSRANQQISRLIKSEKIKRKKTCEYCKEKSETVAHHENYFKPLEIIWLCKSCHRKLHCEKEKIKRSEYKL